MDEESVAAVRALKTFKPRNVGHIRQLLGLLGYHRRHIQDFSNIAEPFSDLLLAKHRDSTRNKSIQKGKPILEKESIEWTLECQSALDKLVDFVTIAPILAYPDLTKEFILLTDASNLGLGAILYQRDNNDKLRVIAYGSRTLKPAETKYHSSKLELLALKWSVTEKFRDYLGYATHFHTYTDNNPLVYVI